LVKGYEIGPQGFTLQVTEIFSYTGLFKMIVGVLTTCHTKYT